MVLSQAQPQEMKAAFPQQQEEKPLALKMLKATTQGFQLYLTRTADKAQRKLDKPLRIRIAEALITIQESPTQVGESLSQPLTGLYSHHLTYKGREFRIAYKLDLEAHLIFIMMIGPHENFYRKLKQLIFG